MIVSEYKRNGVELRLERIGDGLYIITGYSDDMSFNIVFYDAKGGGIDEVLSRAEALFSMIGAFQRLKAGSKNARLGV